MMKEILKNVFPFDILPGINGLPISFIANFFDVSSLKINAITKLHKDKLKNHVNYMSYHDIKNILEINGVKTKIYDHLLYLDYNGYTYTMSCAGQHVFSEEGIMLIATLLHSDKAIEIRNKLYSIGFNTDKYFKESRLNRDMYAHKIDLISDLPKIEGTNYCSAAMLNSYLGLRVYETSQFARSHECELMDSGMVSMTREMFKEYCKKNNIDIVSNASGLTVKTTTGDRCKFVHCKDKMLFFTPEAALRIAMIANSEKAKSIRKMLKTDEITDRIEKEEKSPEVIIIESEIDKIKEENQKLLEDINKMKAFLSSITNDISSLIA